MKSIAMLALAGSALWGAGLAQAATFDLSVTGRLQPASCDLTLGAGGKVDLGVIQASRLSASQSLLLAGQSVTLAIDCATPTKVGLRVQDNREGGAAAESASAGGGDTSFGLGVQGGKPVAERVSFPISNASADGAPVVQLVEIAGGGWSAGSASGTGELLRKNRLLAYAQPGSSLPQAFRRISFTVNPQVYINKSSALDLTREVDIDGSATVELVYL